MSEGLLRAKIRIVIILFVTGLVLSGITAFPLVWETGVLARTIGEGTFMEGLFAPMARWVTYVADSLAKLRMSEAFIFYGTDWLAFAHIVIGIAFIGPLRDPVRNIWVIEFGMIACLLVIPLALICGPIRGIPFFWQLIDCSFGVVGVIPLYICWRWIKELEGVRQGSCGR